MLSGHITNPTITVEIYSSPYLKYVNGQLVQHTSSKLPHISWALLGKPLQIRTPGYLHFSYFHIFHLGSDVILRHPGVFTFRPDPEYFVKALHQRRWFTAVSFITLLY